MEDTSSEKKKQTAFRIAPFAFALLCFLMPFFQISCQGQKFAEVTGLNLVTGKDFESKNPRTGQVKVDRLDAKPVAIAAAVMAVVATVLTVIATKPTLLLSALSSIISFILLVVVRSQFADEIAKGSNGVGTVESMIGYYLACAGLLGGVFVILYQLPQFKATSEKRPESASS